LISVFPKVKSLFYLNQMGILDLTPKESDLYLLYCHIAEPEFRSSVLHLGLDRTPCYTEAVAGEQ